MMKYLPNTRDTPVLRTDFSDNAAWQALCEAIEQPSPEDFHAYVDFIDDIAFTGLSVAEIMTRLQPDMNMRHTILFVVDKATFASDEWPILVVHTSLLSREPGRTFRVIPSEMYSVENNLSISHMDFEDFADNVDDDGVFRGFFE